MSEGAWRMALVASLVLHAAVLAIAFHPPRGQSPKEWLTDFWAGRTFEVPDMPDQPGAGESIYSSTEMANDIEVDGVETSSTTPSNAPTGSESEPLGTRAPSQGAARPKAHAGGPASAAAAPGDGRTGSGQGAFGAEGSAAGVRDLLRSFVRTLPIVASSDPVWSSLPLGPAGASDVMVALDDDGKPRVQGPVPGPQHLRRLILKTVSVMSGGRFGISSTEGIPTEQKMHVAVTLTQQAVPSQDQAVAGGVFGLRYEPPDEHHVSHAFFTLASGRRVEVAVRSTAAR